MTKAKRPEPIAIDLEFEATSTALKNHDQKNQGKAADNPTIAFSLDDEFLNAKNERSDSNVININNIAKTQKEEVAESSFDGFEISMDDLEEVGGVHERTQATVLFNPSMLKDLEKANKAEVAPKKEAMKKEPRTDHKEKTDSRINIKIAPLGLRSAGESKDKNDQHVDLNLLDNLEMVEGIDPSSLTSEFDLNALKEQAAQEQQEQNQNFDSALEINQERPTTLEETGKLELPTADSIDLAQMEDEQASKVLVSTKANELELGSNTEIEMEISNESNQENVVDIASNVMNNMIHMDDLTQEFQINNEKHSFKNNEEENSTNEEEFSLESDAEFVDDTLEENPLDTGLFSGEKELSDPKLDFTQSEVLAQEHEKAVEENLASFDETKEFSLTDALNNDDHDTFSINDTQESISMIEEMPKLPEDAFVAESPASVVQLSDEAAKKNDFYKEIQNYRENRERIIIEESNVGAMIRELREDRDRLLLEVTQISAQFKENEQMLLSLRASLEEAKIENSILKKRQSREFDEAKYQAEVYEDKMYKALESAKIAEDKVVKLQQSIRIDFNQVKQREKELESKLELLMMDFESQVKLRDQKILDFRRKLDSLEFNLESTNLREQKAVEEKKRVEDRLTKIMKTLKHSLHTLEDEVDAPIENIGNKKR